MLNKKSSILELELSVIGVGNIIIEFNIEKGC